MSTASATAVPVAEPPVQAPARGSVTGTVGAPVTDAAAAPSSTAANTVEFSRAARVLAHEARRQRLAAPSFRCPPRVVGVQRTVRRHATGGIVAVQVRDRPWAAVLADMIEGVVVVNRLVPPDADRVRTALWQVVQTTWPSLGAVPAEADVTSGMPRVA